MVKRIVSLLLIVLLLFSIAVYSYARDEQKEHDNDLKKALFGSKDKILTGERKIAFQAIADAAALCIDQFSPNAESRSKEKLFNDLKQRVGFSFSFNDIDLLNGKNGLIVSARTHRRYTHRGWNFPYSMEKEQHYRHWQPGQNHMKQNSR